MMTVSEVWAAGNLYWINGEGFTTRGGKAEDIAKDTPLYNVLMAGTLANEAILEKEKAGFSSTGDPTEIALLVSSGRAGMEKDELLKENPRIDMVPFDARQLYSASIHNLGERKIVFTKGAPEKIVSMCNTQAGTQGQVKIDKENILDEARRMAEEGLRVLAMAMAENDEAADSVIEGNPVGFRFLGLQGMLDPPRVDAARAVSASHRAGIRVIMVTGDSPSTALVIARKVGISKDDSVAVTGPELREMSDSELGTILNKINVYARMDPSQKLRLVNILRRKGEIIAVTGDGVNDAPALKSAHIGTAMGKSGTDVAKEASEMVITDDNFATIYAAVEEGRTVFANIRKATFFLISSGIGEVITILASLALRFPLPLLPAQILWLNVVTNGVEDVALAFEPGEKQEFHRPPHNPKAGILSRLLIERSIIVGLIMAAGTVGMFVWARNGGASLEYARVVALTTLVTFQIFHVFNSRSNRVSIFRMNPLSNRFLLIGTMLSFAVHLGAMYFEPTQTLLRLEPLDLYTWLRIVPLALSVLVVVEIHKIIRRKSP
jgi:Ca2+-transporting ATPase